MSRKGKLRENKSNNEQSKLVSALAGWCKICGFYFYFIFQSQAQKSEQVAVILTTNGGLADIGQGKQARMVTNYGHKYFVCANQFCILVK